VAVDWSEEIAAAEAHVGLAAVHLVKAVGLVAKWVDNLVVVGPVVAVRRRVNACVSRVNPHGGNFSPP
jgi:hypothetical protein